MRKTEKLLAAIATVGLGILLIVLQGTTVQVLTSIFGVLLLALGIMDLALAEYRLGAIKCILGGLIIIFGCVILSAVLYLIAILLIVAAVWWFCELWRAGCLRWRGWTALLQYAQPVLLAAVGVFLLFHAAEGMDWIFILSGILTVVEGSLLFVSAVQYTD